MKNNAFCAFCSSERMIFRKRSLKPTDLLFCGVASTLLMLLIWQGFDARVLIIFVLFLGVIEFGIQTRWRLSVVCPHCGFDPVLYIKDHKAAAEKVKTHLEKRKNDPRYILARPLNIPTIKKSKTSNVPAPKTGSILSKEI